MVLGVLASPGCRTAGQLQFTIREEVKVGTVGFPIELTAADREAAPALRAAVEGAGVKLRRWGDLRVPVTVQVYPTHESLERAVDREGYGWLRAWARYRVVYLQAPRTWSILGASAGQVEELLTHEITHCLMYQLSAAEDDWPYKGIPIWFREGMASVTAEQGYRRGTLADLEALLRDRHVDPVGRADAMYREQADAVYTAAHHAFAFLVGRYGEDGVRRLLATMRGGEDFDEAFQRAVGIPRAAFEDEFRRFVRMEGWRAQR